jgi:hypothetical protein
MTDLTKQPDPTAPPAPDIPGQQHGIDPDDTRTAPITEPDTDIAAAAGVRYPQVAVQLAGRDGNAYAIIARIAAALRDQIGPDAASQFTAEAFACRSYDELLGLAMRTVDVH